MDRTLIQNPQERLVLVTADKVKLEGNLVIPNSTTGIVLFAHGCGSICYSSRNRYVAGVLQQAGLGTLLFDLLTPEEEEIDLRTRHLRFDIRLLASRLVGATDWLTQNPNTSHLKIGYFGASTGGGAALVAAAQRPEVVKAVVSRGGRTDLAGATLADVKAPTLMIVGGYDLPVIAMNEDALEQLRSPKHLEIIPKTTDLFEEPGALAAVAQLASQWFRRYLNHGV
ncbi:dienelactone hydrolase family protein [Nostoc sp. FACHB-152]|uniref:dienelactone hydrolase family protein n=1 Tax=unclassified Nostoc TaxID=2593658 RepID=UPI001686F9E2|nr:MULTISPECIES: dienelactone hydrolase family protein [unclassified Nostoc]MBD2446027.1 dienelactone hydrolase family protein [Nostoc sp. FACHB-152]MBD2467259.1 dienelactone hydrolase family protein [Nostoc sp. FACHB-145]